MPNSEISHGVSEAVDRLTRLYADWSQQQGENYYTLCMLYAMLLLEQKTQKDIAAATSIPKQTVSRFVREMEQKGYLTQQPNEKDRRSLYLQLTPAGKAYAEGLVNPLENCRLQTLKRLGEKKTKQLVSLLTEYEQTLREEMQSAKASAGIGRAE